MANEFLTIFGVVAALIGTCILILFGCKWLFHLYNCIVGSDSSSIISDISLKTIQRIPIQTTEQLEFGIEDATRQAGAQTTRPRRRHSPQQSHENVSVDKVNIDERAVDPLLQEESTSDGTGDGGNKIHVDVHAEGNDSGVVLNNTSPDLSKTDREDINI